MKRHFPQVKYRPISNKGTKHLFNCIKIKDKTFFVCFMASINVSIPINQILVPNLVSTEKQVSFWLHLPALLLETNQFMNVYI